MAANEDAGFTHIKHGDFFAIGQRGFQGPRRHQRMVDAGWWRKGAIAATSLAFEYHTVHQAFERQSVKVKVQAGCFPDQLNRVHVARR